MKNNQYKKQVINTVQVKKNGWLESEIELDAILVLVGAKGGLDAIMNWGLNHLQLFPTPDSLTNRCFALKKQPEMYITAVSEKAAELEKTYTSLTSLIGWQPNN